MKLSSNIYKMIFLGMFESFQIESLLVIYYIPVPKINATTELSVV